MLSSLNSVGNGKGEHGAPERGGFPAVTLPAVGLGDAIDDGQTQSGTARTSSYRTVRRPAGGVFRTSPGRYRLLISKLDVPERASRSRRKRKRAAVRHRVQGIEHEIQEGPAEHVAVRRDLLVGGTSTTARIALAPPIAGPASRERPQPAAERERSATADRGPM